MTKIEALQMIDSHKNKLINLVDMLCWTWLRVIVDAIPKDEWEKYVGSAMEILAR